jgi:DNA (cytosine-5)-methyltransferase 1
MQLVLSLFPGVGLFDRAFERAGFCVVRGPDLIVGGDVRTFQVPRDRIDGIIAGPPCQGYSAFNRYRTDPNHRSVINSLELLAITLQLIYEARPLWWCIENVPNVPDVAVAGFNTQRIAVNDFECGGRQIRWRHFQFGHRHGFHLRPIRINDITPARRRGRRPTATTTKAISRHQTFSNQCRRQGFDKPISLPGWTRTAKFEAVGNGVPFPMGCAIADAVRDIEGPPTVLDCACGCGRPVGGGVHRCATPACRKRIQEDRRGHESDVFCAANKKFRKFFSKR